MNGIIKPYLVERLIVNMPDAYNGGKTLKEDAWELFWRIEPSRDTLMIQIDFTHQGTPLEQNQTPFTFQLAWSFALSPIGKINATLMPEYIGDCAEFTKAHLEDIINLSLSRELLQGDRYLMHSPLIESLGEHSKIINDAVAGYLLS